MNYLKIFSITIAALLFLSCGDNGGGPAPVPPSSDEHFEGTLTVAPGTPGEFVLDGVRVIITRDKEDSSIVDIEILQVKFAEAMQAKIDMAIPGVSLSPVSTGGYTIAGDGIVPTAMGGDLPQYTIRDLEGGVDKTGETLSFEMVCGSFPVSYVGERRHEI